MRAIALIGLLAVLVGCPAGSDDDTGIPADDDSAPTDDDATGDDDTAADDDSGIPADDDVESGLLARISVVESVEQGTAAASAHIGIWGINDRPWSAGLIPDWWVGCDGEGDTGIWVQSASAGDCLLAVKVTCSGDCEPPCILGEYCTTASSCEAIPELRDAGVLTIDGLSTAVSLTPTGEGRYVPQYGLPSGLFAPGDEVTLTAAGAATDAFSATATGTDIPDAELPCAQIPEPDQDLTVTWTPSGDASARMRWEMLQNVHNAQGPRIRCEVEDAGSLTVPASLIAPYLYGPTHTFTLTRYTVDEVSMPGSASIAFEVQASRYCVID